MSLSNFIRSVVAIACYASLTAQAAVVGISPASQTFVPGKSDPPVVTITGSGFDVNVDGGLLDVVWDEDVLNLVSVTIAPVWDLINNPGTVGEGTLTGLDFATFANTVTGSFDIATLEFSVVGEGLSPIQVSGSIASAGQNMTVDFADGSVQAIPEPSTAWLLVAGIGLLVVLRMRPVLRKV